jgi:hypothetical protein
MRVDGFVIVACLATICHGRRISQSPYLLKNNQGQAQSFDAAEAKSSPLGQFSFMELNQTRERAQAPTKPIRGSSMLDQVQKENGTPFSFNLSSVDVLNDALNLSSLDSYAVVNETIDRVVNKRGPDITVMSPVAKHVYLAYVRSKVQFTAAISLARTGGWYVGGLLVGHFRDVINVFSLIVIFWVLFRICSFFGSVIRVPRSVSRFIRQRWGHVKPAMSKLMGYACDRTIQISTIEGEAQLRKSCPKLLLTNEKVVMAFKDRSGWGRGDSFFTNIRVLVRDVRGVSGKCVKYTSIPYDIITAWSVDTPGMMDPECTLKFWSQGVGYKAIDYLTGHVDMFEIMRHFSKYCLLGDDGTPVAARHVDAETPRLARANTEPALAGTSGDPFLAGTPPSACNKLLNVLGDDEGMVDKDQLEYELKQNVEVLVDDETVELAFRTGVHAFVLTSHRVLRIALQGETTARKIEYLSINWKQIKLFSLQTKGAFKDTNAQLVLFTDIPGMARIEQDLKKGKADVAAIQKAFANQLLGKDTSSFVAAAGDKQGDSKSAFAGIGGISKMIDAAQMNHEYHINPPILQGSETVEMAFRGRRDLILFTTKRMIKVDVQALGEQKVTYISIPWRTVQCFGVRSANHDPKKDAELLIWTNVNDVSEASADQPTLVPRMSYLQTDIDFKKDKVDPMTIHRYLSERCLGSASSKVLVDPSIIKPSGSVTLPDGFSTVENFLEMDGNDAYCISASEVEKQLKSANRMLRADERVGLAYQLGRDMIILTTKRVISVDVEPGSKGSTVEWKSIPYEAIKGFSVESAGSFDREDEIKLFTRTYWKTGGPGSVFSRYLRKGKCDILAMQKYMAAHVLGSSGGSSNSPPAVEASPSRRKSKSPKAEDILSGISADAEEVPLETISSNLRSSLNILQNDEEVERAYKVGRDLLIFTTKRVLSIDVQGWTGKKVEYMSYPLKYCRAFEVQSPGAITFFQHSAHAAIFTDIPGRERIEHEMKKGKADDIWDLHAHLATKLLHT